MITAIALFAAVVFLLILGVGFFRRHQRAIEVFISRQWTRAAASPKLTAVRARYPRSWNFVVARFARGEYLGLHLTVGFVVSIVALRVFAGITEDVVNHDPLTLFDIEVASWARSHAVPLGDRLAMMISAAGNPGTMSALAIVVAAMLAYRRLWISLAGWLAALVGVAALNSALKFIIHRPRPVGAEDFLHGTSFSFPSGHAMGSLVGYAMVCYLLIAFWSPARQHRTTVIAVTLVLVLLIGLSRLYLGVHYLSDVIAGYAAGAIWVAVCITGIEIALGQRGLSQRRVSGQSAD